MLTRVAPFAVVAALAEASLALPPGPQSAPGAIVSVLLLAVPVAFLLPWPRLPEWATVFVPLLYTGSALALILAAGATSGVGIVILIPLVWTALFHQRWESGCVVAAVVAVEVTISLTPVAADSVIVRRVLLWALLGTLISVATHGLRDRINRSQAERARLRHPGITRRERRCWPGRSRRARWAPRSKRPAASSRPPAASPGSAAWITPAHCWTAPPARPLCGEVRGER